MATRLNNEKLNSDNKHWRPTPTFIANLIFWLIVELLTLTLEAPISQNGQTQTIRRQYADELFECV